MVIENGLAIDKIIDECKNLGISHIIQIAAAPEKTMFAVDISRTFNIYYALGMHPNDVHDSDPEKQLTFINQYKSDPRFKAIGEIGLDYHYSLNTRDLQKVVFEKYLELAIELNKPVIIHTRDAHVDTIYLLKKYYAKLKILIHCFTGNSSQMHEFLELGAYISFSGIVTFRSATEIQEAAKLCPADKILIETDAPYLTPMPYRGKTNHPALVRYTYDFLEKLRDDNSLHEQIYINSKKFFSISD